MNGSYELMAIGYPIFFEMNDAGLSYCSLQSELDLFGIQI